MRQNSSGDGSARRASVSQISWHHPCSSTLAIEAALREAIQNAIDNASVPIGEGETDLPPGAESCLTPFGDPVQSDNDNNPWELGWGWLTGDGDAQCFGPDDEFTRLYRADGYTQKTIDFFADMTQSGEYELGHTYYYDYDLGGFEGVRSYLGDLSWVATNGSTGNLAYTYLGSHDIRMTPIRENPDGSVVWRYTAYNESDIESATHPPLIGYTDWWSESVGSLVDSIVGDSGPMSRTTQVIEFEVTLGP